jgi:large subunit ribosomal protein L5
MTNDNPMRAISVEKVTLNMGCGNDAKKMEKGMALLKQLTGVTPVKTKTSKRIAQWGLRPGLPIGVKVTLRGKEALKVLDRCIAAKERQMKKSMFDENGNISFGIKEYIDIPEAQYDPKIGIIGLQVTATLKRPGVRVRTRVTRPARIPKKHRIGRDEAIAFAAENFKVKVE